MEKVTLDVGSVVGMSAGTQDRTRPVEFVGEKLATRREFGDDPRRGGPTDTRGVDETLYRAEDGRLVVHIKDWSQWQGEPNTYSLCEVTEDDLGVGGRFEDLGREAGLGRPLTLDEALSSGEGGPA